MLTTTGVWQLLNHIQIFGLNGTYFLGNSQTVTLKCTIVEFKSCLQYKDT